MEMSAAVFRKVHEPLTIEQVSIDKPRGREVLVRSVATGPPMCSSRRSPGAPDSLPPLTHPHRPGSARSLRLSLRRNNRR